MTLPPMPDETIYFPFVQRCEVGEIRWIQVPDEPGDEVDEPAPAMALTGPVATVPSQAPATTLVTEPTEPESSPPAPTTDPATTDPATTELVAVPSTSEPALVSAGVDDGTDSRIGTIMFIASVAAVLGIGAFVVFRSRQARGRVPNVD